MPAHFLINNDERRYLNIVFFIFIFAIYYSLTALIVDFWLLLIDLHLFILHLATRAGVISRFLLFRIQFTFYAGWIFITPLGDV